MDMVVEKTSGGSNSSSSNENTSSSNTTNSHSSSSNSSNAQTKSNKQDLPKKSQSETSLLNHSYQALKMSESLTDNIFDCDSQARKKKLKRSTSCDCDLECTCENPEEDEDRQDGHDNENDEKHHKKRLHPHLNHKQQFILSEAMLTADEITVSESDNNSTTVKRCERNQHGKLKSPSKNCGLDDASYHNANNIDIYSDGDAEAITEACLKETNGAPGSTTSDLRPPLPPRPPPRPKNTSGSTNETKAYGDRYRVRSEE
ncbi:hypothetical protein DOY81_007438 [Sarcophaga bullata]|nr:hypothetical protein DOY81_007438 [Sarcophaga bullata]